MRKHQLSIFSISMLSLYVIAASIMPIFMKSLTDNSKALLAFTSIVASIFIIVLTHVEAGLSYSTKAERLFRSAQKMSDLYYALKQKSMSNVLTQPLVDDIRKRYCEILNDYSENHEEIDFLYFSNNFSPNPPTDAKAKVAYFLKGRYYATLYYSNILLSHVLLIIIPPVLLLLFLSGTLHLQ